MPTQTYYSDVLLQSFSDLWGKVASFVPNVVFAIILFLIGWIVALALEQVVVRLLKALQVEKLLSRLGWDDLLRRMELKFDASNFIGALVRWFIVIAVLLAVADILNLDALTDFLQRVLLYIPNIIVAALILLVAAIVGDFLDRLIVASVKAAGFSYGRALGAIAKWSILVFGLLIALDQMQIGGNIINTLFTGLVAMIAIAGGLAFGFGGKDLAAEMLSRLKARVEDRE